MAPTCFEGGKSTQFGESHAPSRRFVLVVVPLTLLCAAYPAAAQTATTVPITLTPNVIRPANGKLASSMTLAVSESNCDDKAGTDLTGAGAPYSLQITGSGLKASSLSPQKCKIMATLTIDPNAAGNYTVFLLDKAKNQVGSADIGVLDSTAGPIPPGVAPEVDVMWEVMSQNNCSDVFGKRVAQSLYCVQLKIGNNSGHPIQIAGVGFTKDLKAIAALGLPEVTISNSSYASTRAVLLQSQVWSNRNIIANSIQGAGLIMGGFIPFYSGSHSPNSKLHFTTAAGIVSGVGLQAYNLIVPDPIIAQLKSLDDQSFRDNMVILNNSHTQTVVFVEKQAVTTALKELRIELSQAAALAQGQVAAKTVAGASSTAADVANAQSLQVTADTLNEMVASSQRTIKNSTRPPWVPFVKKGHPNPLLVKLALGRVVIVGDMIEYLQRVQIQSSAAPSPASTPVTASPSTLSFSGQNGITNGGAQLITLANSSNLPLTDITIQSPATKDFIVQSNTSSPCAPTLAAGDKCTISVAYNPVLGGAAASPRTGTLQVSFSPGPAPLAIPLTGTALDTVYFSGTVLSFDPATVAKAGPPAVGATSSTAKLTITNFESTSMTIASPIPGTDSGDFVVSSPCTTPLPAATSCTITVKFTPTAIGARTATMTVSYRIGAGAPLQQTISLSGTGQ
jgi:hypothetical protein